MKINLHCFNNIFKTIKKIDDNDEKHKLIDQNKHLLVNHIVKTDDNYYIIKNIINNDELDVFNVKEKIKDSYIVLFDNSVFIQDEYNNLKNNVDCFINITNDNDLNFYTDKFKYKAFSEMFQTIKCYEYFISKINKKYIKNIFKISGRYFLNDNFDYNKFDNNDNIFKKNKELTEMKYYYTSFYKISGNFSDDFFKLLTT